MPASAGGGCQAAIARGLEWLTGLLVLQPLFWENGNRTIGQRAFTSTPASFSRVLMTAEAFSFSSQAHRPIPDFSDNAQRRGLLQTFSKFLEAVS